jgi:NAD-dependent dihydropyrimidine dehydrogenase PreA subunit
VEVQDTILPRIDPESCTGCGECVTACPAGALALRDGRAAIAHPEDCQYCGNCEELCPEGAVVRPFEIVFGEAADDTGS